MTVPISPTAPLAAALDELAERLESIAFGLDAPAAPTRRRRRDTTVRSIRRHLVPRLRHPDAPLLVVVFGPTGSGKSTLVNALAGRVVSRPGPVRPTTRSAVVWCHPRNEAGHRVSALADSGPVEYVVDTHPLLERVTIVDTPDIDSYVEEHRAQTEDLLAMADAAVSVTTAQRYADAVPWELLRRLAERRIPLLVVANRMSRRTAGATADLVSLLRDRGVKSVSGTDDVFEIREQRLRDGLLPQAAVRHVAGQLDGLARAHDRAVERSVAGALAADLAAAGASATDVREQAAEADALWTVAAARYEEQSRAFAERLEHGDLVRSEVLTRWRRLVGVTDLARMVAGGAGRLASLLRIGPTISDDTARNVESEVRDELVDLVVERVRRAVDATADAWELDPAGRVLLERDLLAPDPSTAARARDEVDEWFASLVALVRERGRTRFRVARAASVGVNAAAVVLLLGVFGASGGISGAEAGIVVGAAAAQQSLLEHLFGTAAARLLADRARRDLVERVARVLDLDAARHRRALDAVTERASTAAALEETITTVGARFRELGRG